MMALRAAVTAALVASAAAQPLPRWTAPLPNVTEPFAGYPLLPGVRLTNVFMARPDWPAAGTYSHLPMLDFHAASGRLVLAWSMSPRDEGQPGTKAMFSSSADGGATWSPAVELFPNISTNGLPALVIAQPFLTVGGRLYAAGSMIQSQLWPVDAIRQPYGLLRTVDWAPDGAAVLGPVFWATATPPAGMALASALNNITTVAQQDAQTRADVARVNNASAYGADGGWLPCGDAAAALKCETCGAGGCPAWASTPAAVHSNERTHYIIPGSDPRLGTPDVLLYRSPNATNFTPPFVLWASVRTAPGGGWSEPAATDMPNSPSNMNAGPLPDGRRYLVFNPGPGRDPLVWATTADGWAWDAAWAVVSCSQLGPNRTACSDRYAGWSKGTGVAYPQAVVLANGTAVVAFSNNKEDIWTASFPVPG